MAKRFPPDLEERITALESQAECGDDFDPFSWWWLIILGVLIPIGLILIGWWL
jgi:hypothetical protein